MRKAIGPMIRWLPLAVALALAGCAQETVPQDQFYRLRVAVPAQAFGAPPLQGTLEVERLDADGLIASRPIVYSNAKTPNRVDEYHYHFWTESPPVLVQDALVAYLRGVGAAKVVVTPEVRVEPDYELSGRLSRFEQVRGAGAKVVAEIELRLRELELRSSAAAEDLSRRGADRTPKRCRPRSPPSTRCWCRFSRI